MSPSLYEIMLTMRLCSVHDNDERSISAARSETSPGDVKPLIIVTKDTEWSLGAAMWTELGVEIEVER